VYRADGSSKVVVVDLAVTPTVDQFVSAVCQRKFLLPEESSSTTTTATTRDAFILYEYREHTAPVPSVHYTALEADASMAELLGRVGATAA
jgi:hypothetical protein